MEASTRAFATPGMRPVFPVAAADTSLPATFAWMVGAVSSAPVANPRRPAPQISPVLQQLQYVLDRLEPQADEGDITGGLSDEIASWSEDRARATRPFIDDD